MEIISKLDPVMDFEKVTTLLNSLEKTDFSFSKGRIVKDTKLNLYTLESFIKVFKEEKESGSASNRALENFRLKLIDLYQPNNFSEEVKELFYSTIAPFKGLVGKKTLGLNDSIWKQVARYSVPVLGGGAALLFVGSKLLRSGNQPNLVEHEICKSVSIDYQKTCNILASSKENLEILKQFNSQMLNSQKELSTIKAIELETHQKLKTCETINEQGSLGFKDPKILDKAKNWDILKGNEQTVLSVAYEMTLDVHASANAIEFVENVVTNPRYAMNQEVHPAEKEKLQKETLKVLFSLYARQGCYSKKELALTTIFSDIRSIHPNNLKDLKEFILASQESSIKPFILQSYHLAGLTDAQKLLLDHLVIRNINDPQYLNAAIERAADLFKISSEIPRAIQILKNVLAHSTPEMIEKNRLNLIKVLKLVSLKEVKEVVKDDKNAPKDENEASSIISLLVHDKFKMTMQETIDLAKHYLYYHHNNPTMKKMSFDLLGKFLVAQKGITEKQQNEIASVVQQALNKDLDVAILDNLKQNILPNLKDAKFTVSDTVLRDFANNKNTAECALLAEFMNNLNRLNKSASKNPVFGFANLLFDQGGYYFSKDTDLDMQKHVLALKIYHALSKQNNYVMSESYWQKMESVFEKTHARKKNPAKLTELSMSIGNAKTLNDKGQIAKYEPSEHYKAILSQLFAR